MSTKTNRFAEAIHAIASPIILSHVREHSDEFGIVSITDIEITKDRSYVDIFISASEHEADLPKFLSPLAGQIRHEVGQAIETYKIPQVRFRRVKNKETERSVYDLITEISNQYGLHEEN